MTLFEGPYMRRRGPDRRGDGVSSRRSRLVDGARFGGRNRLVFDDSTVKILGGGPGDIVGEIRAPGGQALVQALSGLHHSRDCPRVLAGHGRPVAAIIGHAVGVDLYNHSVHLFFLRLTTSTMTPLLAFSTCRAANSCELSAEIYGGWIYPGGAPGALITLSVRKRAI